jgi:hypothetical protein
MNTSTKIWWLIALSIVVRLLVAGLTELGNDEVYYWTYAQHLQMNYFDHPPMVALLIRLTTINLLLQSEFFVRLGAVISSGLSTWIIFKIGTFLNNERTGWYAALLYTGSLYSSIIAGIFILPDSPQMVFWLLGIFLLFKIKDASSEGLSVSSLWMWFGIVAGMCMMSKVHGVFLWVAVGMFALFFDRKWLLKKEMYIAMGISLLIISPIIIWNVRNNFITYTYHGGRINLNGGGFNGESFIRELTGTLFYNNPINFVLIWISIFGIRGLNYDKSKLMLILFCGLPLIGLTLGISVFRETLPHWSGPGYTALILIAAIYLDSKYSSVVKTVPTVIRASIILILFVVIAGTGLIKYYPGTIGSSKSIILGDGDFTLDMYGWEQAGSKMDSICKADKKNKLMEANAPILVNKWFPAAHIDYYIASVTGQTTYALGELFDLHHYQWLNNYKPALKLHGDAYFIMPSNDYNEKSIALYKQRFDSVSEPVSIPVYRNSFLCKKVYVYRLKGFISR